MLHDRSADTRINLKSWRLRSYFNLRSSGVWFSWWIVFWWWIDVVCILVYKEIKEIVCYGIFCVFFIINNNSVCAVCDHV